VGEERMPFKSFNNSHNSVVATDSKVVALADIVGKDDPRSLADAREHGEQNSSLQRLGFINDDK
jgi:hypothetical protein